MLPWIVGIPRDLFDVKHLLENKGFTEEVKTGFIFGVLSSERPINELLNLGLTDQLSAMSNQFEGIGEEDLTYKDFEATRDLPIKTIHEKSYRCG